LLSGSKFLRASSACGARFEMAFGKLAIHFIEMTLPVGHQLFSAKMIEGTRARLLKTCLQGEERRTSRFHFSQPLAAGCAYCEVFVKRQQFAGIELTLAIKFEKLC
jgi:hypothetical protein